MALQNSFNLDQVTTTPDVTRRKNLRFSFAKTADWDFFTAANGIKPGYIEDVSQGGCLLRTSDVIEHRRWIRLAVQGDSKNLWFTAVGRVIRREDKMEATPEGQFTLYRYGVEFIHSLNPLILEQVRGKAQNCSVCGNPAANIPDTKQAGTLYCVLCHLRKACQNLLAQEDEAV